MLLYTRFGRKLAAFSQTNTGNMKTMLILTDFSEQAFRAAEYACELAGCLHIKQIVLYHSYQPVMAYAGPSETAINANLQQTYTENMEALGLLQDRLKSMLPRDINIEMVAKETGVGGIPYWIDQQSGKESIDIIVMGISGRSGLDKFLMGSTTAEILRKNKWPVLVVPEAVPLGRGIKTIVFTSDLKETDSIPADQLYEFLEALPAKLQVVNVERETEGKYSPDTEKGISALHKLLDKYDPGFNYITGDDTVKEILGFAKQQQASLIIAVHQQRGFLSSIFHKSVTKKLAYNSDIPLLSLPGTK